jgi:tRNA(Arg) A34 adenosine deaminase TadA
MAAVQDEDLMRRAISKACSGIRKGQTPFGACVVRNGKVVSCEHNRVWMNMDITAHAEILAIRKACRTLSTVDLSGCTVFSTCEPCPMCFSACHWAGISRIVYGAEIDDAKDHGFNELFIPSATMNRYDDKRVEIRGSVLRDECVDLFIKWAMRRGSQPY